MIVTLTLALDLDDLLDALDLELLEDEEYDAEYDIDEDGTIWFYDEETDTDYYFDEDLDDWAEVDEYGIVWYVDEDEVVYVYDDFIEHDWVLYEEDEDASAW